MYEAVHKMLKNKGFYLDTVLTNLTNIINGSRYSLVVYYSVHNITYRLLENLTKCGVTNLQRLYFLVYFDR